MRLIWDLMLATGRLILAGVRSGLLAEV